jgi:hypothetical protein
MNTFVLKESEDFRLRVQISRCKAPDNLYCVEFLQETLRNKQIEDVNKNQLFLTKFELNMLSDRIKLNDY